MVITIEVIREMARLNLDPKCFDVYLRMVEPNIIALAKDFFKDWQSVEVALLGLYLQKEGAYKTKDYYEIDKEHLDGYSKVLDIKKYRKAVFELKVKGMITDLFTSKVIGENLHAMLIELNKRRNKVHKYHGEITDDERTAFNYAYSFLMTIFLGLVDGGRLPYVRKLQFDTIEKNSKAILQSLKENQKSSKFF